MDASETVIHSAKQKVRPKRKVAWGRHLKHAAEVIVALAVAGGVALSALPDPVPVEVAKAEKGELVVTVDEDGRSRVKDRYVVSAPLAGNVARLELHPGDEVAQGAVLSRIVPLRSPLLDARSRSETEARMAAALAATKQADAQIERVRAALSFAEKEAIRSQQLLAGGAISAQETERAALEKRAREAELTSAVFGSKVAVHELRMTQAALGQLQGTKKDSNDQFEVPSPIAGRVLRVIQESEGVVQPGSPLLELGDPSALEIAVDVLTKDAVNIKPGSLVSIEEWGGTVLPAVVRLIEPSAFTRLSALGVEEQRVNTIIDLNAPYEMWRQLGDGYRVEARIETFRAANAICVPASALFRRNGDWAAFVLDNGVARLRKLSIGRRNDRQVEVLSGIEAGDWVIVHPSDKVTDGGKVVQHEE